MVQSNINFLFLTLLKLAVIGGKYTKKELLYLLTSQ